MESIFEPKDAFTVEPIDDNPDLASLMQAHTEGILCVPESVVKRSSHKVLTSQTYDFAKWLRKNREDITIEVAESDGTRELHAGDLWIPIAILAVNMSVQVYLNLVSSYIYDRVKGALKHDRTNVHVEVYYKESPEGVTMRFRYDGSVEGLQEVATRFNINKFIG